MCRFVEVVSLQQIWVSKLQIAQNNGSENRKSANSHTCGRSTNVTNFMSPQIYGFSEAWGKMIHEKKSEAKIL